jgi:hypothetical protein
MNKTEPKYRRKSWIKLHHERKLALLDYIKTPQAATDTAVELDVSLQVVLKYMRELKASGHVEQLGENHYTKYMATGKELRQEGVQPSIKYNTGFTLLGVRF